METTVAESPPVITMIPEAPTRQSPVPPSHSPPPPPTPPAEKDSFSSDHHNAGHEIASSPILHNFGAVPESYNTPGSKRTSKASSFRLSKDLKDFIHDNDDIPEEEDKDHEAENLHGPAYDETLDTSNNGSNNDDEPVTYNTLSKRADFILQNAKRKLNLLEGNLGRARHSLLVSPHVQAELRTTSSLSSYTPTLDQEGENRRMRVGPRIKFTPSREARNSPTTSSPSSLSHSRGFSETSVPSPLGYSIKGSRSLDYMEDTDLVPRLTQPKPIVEEEDEGLSNESMQNIRELYGVAPVAKTTKDLRDQADELRNRIAFLQKRSQGSDSKRTSLNSVGGVPQDDEAFFKQVSALQVNLSAQEEVIEELEQAERRAEFIENDPRGEWEHVLNYNENADDDESDFSDEGEAFPEYDAREYDLDPEVEAEALAGPHEERVDAFDYEHFILHSVMGAGVTRSSDSDSEPRSASEMGSDDDSRGSASTARGEAVEGGAEDWNDNYHDHHPWSQMQQPNDSIASFATAQSFETANEGGGYGSDDDSVESDPHHEALMEHGMDNTWPMPPAQTTTSTMKGNVASKDGTEDAEGHTPTADKFSFPEGAKLRASQESQIRPTSKIYATLMNQEAQDLNVELSEKEQQLLKSVVESLQELCKNYGGKEVSKPSWSERLKVAKSILDGGFVGAD